MTEIIKSINTAVIMHEGHLLALAMKVHTSQGQEELYYMQHIVIRDILLVMNNKLRTVVEKIKHEGESYKALLIAENQSLMQNLPPMRQEDLHNPDPNRRVMSIALKQDGETFTIIAALQNGHVGIIRFSNSQAEFVLHAITQALQNSGDKESLMHLCSALDFIPLYDANLNGNVDELDFQQYPHEAWRQELFPNHVAILFSYQTSEGEKILRGAVVKTYLTAQSPEIQSIAARIASLMPQFKAMQEKHQLKQIFSRDIPAETNQPLTTEQCLRPLRNFYLEMNSK